MGKDPKYYLKSPKPTMADRLTRYWEYAEEAIPEALTESVSDVQNTFKRAFDRLQGAWKSLDPRYKARKVKQGYRPEILRRTDAYYDALTKGTSDSIIRIESTGIRYSISDSLWSSHVQWHEGAGRVERKFELEKSEIDTLWKKIRRAISNKLFRKAGG